jgi:Flp pilus assembly protein TadG
MPAADRRRLERGASALEMAFVAPGLILLIFFSIQAALFFYGRNVAIQAAREGVSQMRVAADAAT